MIDVSVIIPVYNAEKYITKNISSLKAQTFRNFEVLFVNDGSTDRSEMMIAQQWNDCDIKMQIISQENGGQGFARNTGIRAAKGNFLCFVDIDDYISEQMLEKLVDAQRKNDADIVWCDAFIVKNGEVVGTLKINELYADDANRYFFLNNASPWRKLIRRSLIMNEDLYFPKIRFYEDVSIVPAYAAFAEKIEYIDVPLYYYVLHEGSTMHQKQYDSRLECIFDAMSYLATKIANTNSFYKDELEYLYIDHLLHAAALRFLAFPEGKKQMKRIIEIFALQYPNWQKNPYFITREWKYKLICKLLYHQQFWLLKRLLKQS